MRVPAKQGCPPKTSGELETCGTFDMPQGTAPEMSGQAAGEPVRPLMTIVS